MYSATVLNCWVDIFTTFTVSPLWAAATSILPISSFGSGNLDIKAWGPTWKSTLCTKKISKYLVSSPQSCGELTQGCDSRVARLGNALPNGIHVCHTPTVRWKTIDSSASGPRTCHKLRCTGIGRVRSLFLHDLSKIQIWRLISVELAKTTGHFKPTSRREVGESLPLRRLGCMCTTKVEGVRYANKERS